MSTRSLCQLGILACVFGLVAAVGCGGSSKSADNPTVYTADGEASYHVEGCPNLGADAKALTKNEAERKGLKPCIRCLKSSLAALSASAQTYGNKAQDAIDAEIASSDAVNYEFYGKPYRAKEDPKATSAKSRAVPSAPDPAKLEEIRRLIAKTGSFPKIKSLKIKSEKDEKDEMAKDHPQQEVDVILRKSSLRKRGAQQNDSHGEHQQNGKSGSENRENINRYRRHSYRPKFSHILIRDKKTLLVDFLSLYELYHDRLSLSLGPFNLYECLLAVVESVLLRKGLDQDKRRLFLSVFELLRRALLFYDG